VFYYNVLPVKTAEAPVLNEYVVITAIQKPNVCVYSVAVPHRLFLPGIACTSCLQSKIHSNTVTYHSCYVYVTG
jgi:hypothetical protein